MKLYNRTRINDDVLIALIVKAGRSIGARTSDVIVQVNSSRGAISGTAHECSALKIKGRWIETDGGYFRACLPTDLCHHQFVVDRQTDPDKRAALIESWKIDPLDTAQAFLEAVRHEWGHIRDYQTGGRYKHDFSKRGTAGRRPAHDSRPEEIRANDYIYDSDRRIKPDHFYDVVMALAFEIERISNAA